MDIQSYAWLAYLAPLAGTLLILLGGTRLPVRGAGFISVAAMVLSFTAAVATLFRWNDSDREHAVVTKAFTWLSSGTFHVDFDLYVDSLSIWMLLVVTGVGLLIHVYSLGYMEGDPQKRRFMAYLNLFVFSMLTLVLAGNLVFLLVGWGLVGMASYLLIGFWHDRPTAVAAAKKAFIVNAIGDVSIMLGLFLVFRETGVTGFGDVFRTLPTVVDPNSGMAYAICALLLGGALAKSAQLPLHTWLPDAMEGPTPVSALIHAATMVTAGVYAISRLHPIFDLSMQSQKTIIVIGGLTLLMAGFTALAQTDIKRVIAYSTMSQIGYMFVAAGVGAYQAAMFHLMTHAFFKALLFLGAGLVIHALADEQDIRKMGGLRRYMPKTYVLFFVGSLALAGVIPFAGFFSKDEILGFLLASGDVYGGWAYAVYGLAVAGAVLTGLYAFRLVFLVFHGEPSDLVTAYGKGEVMHHGHATNEHGEAPKRMLLPVAVLGLLTVVGGLIGIPGVTNIPGEFLHHAHSAPTREALEAVEFTAAKSWLLALTVGLGAAFLGLLGAWLVWGRRGTSSLRTKFPRLERVFQRAFGWDALYDATLARPVQGIAGGLRELDDATNAQVFEEVEIGFRDAGNIVRGAQAGLLRVYAFGTGLAFVALLVAFLVVKGG